MGIYSIILIALALVAGFIPILMPLPVIFAPLGHELLVLFSRQKELAGEALFPLSDDFGIKVLAVVPNSVADKMGLKPGFTLKRINGEFLQNYHHFQQMLAENPTYLKVEVEDAEGRTKYLSAPLFGRRRQVGLITMPSTPPNTSLSMEFSSPLDRFF